MSHKPILIAIGVVGAAIALFAAARVFAIKTIEYRGETVKLARYYFGYDDYKNDPNNIDSSETARVQRLVSQAPIARSFANRFEIATAVGEVAFPGYGYGGFGDGMNDGPITGFSVEIPRSDETRYFIFRKTNTGYLLIDDFLDSSMPGINHVEESSGHLIYTMTGRPEKLVRTVPNLQ
jgi:hypothetical protein